MKRGQVSFAILGALLGNEILDSFAQYCFKRAADSQGAMALSHLSAAWPFLLGVVSSGYLWLGIALIALVFTSWTSVLSKVDLSVASPITSFSYVFVALTSLIFLHEHISALRWTGIVCILVGVAIVSHSAETEEKQG
ncbi:MAG TPA: EamA family transporter [Opitutaceae bacterium]